MLGTYRVRDLTTPDGQPKRFTERGSYVEVLDGGTFGPRNVIRLGRDGDELDDAATQLECIAGNCVVAGFDWITADFFGADTVRLAIRTGDALPVEQPVTGKPRVRLLSRGIGVSCANAAAITLLDRTSVPFDEYDNLERFRMCEWFGWVASTKQYEVWSSVRANPQTPTGELLAQKFIVRDYSTPVATGITGTKPYVCTFEQLGPGGDIIRPLMLPNFQRLQLANTDVVSGTFSWIIGVRG